MRCRVGLHLPAAVVALLGCSAESRPRETAATITTADSLATPDSIPEERPDSVRSTPADSTTMVLALLPEPGTTPLTGLAADLAERAVFVPRTQRWFMTRTTDSVLTLDIGRIDGGVGTSDDARAALAQMLRARSPLQPGHTVTVHARSGETIATVATLALSGRRLLAHLQTAESFDAGPAAPAEWRGAPPVAWRTPPAARCSAGDTVAVANAIARYVPGAKEAVTSIRGCFGDFRAVITVRPLEITPESVERVVLVRADGRTRSGKLRDLSYPLHVLIATADVDRDGRDEIVVHSFRPAMETWAALRMTDSITFTRFASGFTIEKR